MENLPAHEDGNDDEKSETPDDGDPFLDSPDSVGTDAQSDELQLDTDKASLQGLGRGLSHIDYEGRIQTEQSNLR